MVIFFGNDIPVGTKVSNVENLCKTSVILHPQYGQRHELCKFPAETNAWPRTTVSCLSQRSSNKSDIYHRISFTKVHLFTSRTNMAIQQRTTRNAASKDNNIALTLPLSPNTQTKKTKTSKPRDSEFHAYAFIRDNLKELGWDIRNPARHAEGQVYTQQECLSHPELKACLNLDRPENVIKVTESAFWVIEAKPNHKDIETALSEAIDYAKKINRSSMVKAVFVSGVAGNPSDGYLIRTRYTGNGRPKPITINDKEISALITPDIAKTVLLNGSPTIADIPINESLFLAKAEKINQYLHLGAINKNQRARVMAALLLALIEDTPPNIDAIPRVLVQDINSRAQAVLEEQGKKDFFKFIEIAMPPTTDNHFKFKAAIVSTIQELNNLNIRSAMNSGADVLGKFYEVFLKYGNGAKEIGIVLTPRHMTKFAVDILGVTHRDVVLDVTCGTAGFLVAAFDEVKRKSNATQLGNFKTKNLFGIEQESEVVALAIVNMIFRGDGKSNIIEGNCFQKNVVRKSNGEIGYSQVPPTEVEAVVTRVFMNPPFALKSSDEKEFKFITQALRQMQDGGLLFCILPYSAMAKSGVYQTWRTEELLKNNTLLSVITLPEDLFYPVGVHTVAIIVEKGNPHPSHQSVLWIRALNDGLLKSKGKRLPSVKASDDYSIIRSTLNRFIADPHTTIDNIEKFQKACPIDFSDPQMELIPENYLDQPMPTTDELVTGMDALLREYVAFLIRNKKEGEIHV